MGVRGGRQFKIQNVVGFGDSLAEELRTMPICPSGAVGREESGVEKKGDLSMLIA